MWRWALVAFVVMMGCLLAVVLSDESPQPASLDEAEAVGDSGPPVATEPEFLPVPVIQVNAAAEESDDVTLPDRQELLADRVDEKKRKQWEKELTQKCIRLYRRKDYENAKECFELRLVLDPDNAESHLNLGILAAKTGDASEAYHRYQKFLELDPDNSRARQVERILDQYDKHMIGDDGPEPAEKPYTATKEAAQPNTAPNEALERTTRLIRAGHIYGNALMAKESDRQKALKLAEEALSLVPEASNLRTALLELKRELESEL